MRVTKGAGRKPSLTESEVLDLFRVRFGASPKAVTPLANGNFHIKVK